LQQRLISLAKVTHITFVKLHSHLLFLAGTNILEVKEKIKKNAKNAKFVLFSMCYYAISEFWYISLQLLIWAMSEDIKGQKWMVIFWLFILYHNQHV